MDPKFVAKIIEAINEIEDRLSHLEGKVSDVDYESQQGLDLISSQLIRVKNGEKLPDDYLLNRRRYLDLTPSKAHSIYHSQDLDFVIIDVSHEAYQAEITFPEVIKMPLEDIHTRYLELPNRSTNILVISEDGTRSILACEKLNEFGFYNVSNVSGGYKFWPDLRNKEIGAA